MQGLVALWIGRLRAAPAPHPHTRGRWLRSGCKQRVAHMSLLHVLCMGRLRAAPAPRLYTRGI